MLNDKQIAAYREMAKNAGENSMEAQIKSNIEKTCDKFKGHREGVTATPHPQAITAGTDLKRGKMTNGNQLNI